jgi:hypothetical protein
MTSLPTWEVSLKRLALVAALVVAWGCLGGTWLRLLELQDRLARLERQVGGLLAPLPQPRPR